MNKTSEQLRDLLIEAVRERRLDRGDAMPSIREISRVHEVSKAIAERAVRSLVADGICYAEQGRGVFLAVGSDEGLEAKLVAARTVAVVFGYLEYPATDHHFYRQVFEGIQEWIIANQCNVLKLYNWQRKSTSQKNAELARFVGGVDGLIALGVYSDEDCIRLRNTGLPLAVVDHDTELLGVDCAVIDDIPAFGQLAEKVIDASSGEVCFVQTLYESGEDPSAGARLRLVEKAVKKAGRGSVKVVSLSGDDTSQDRERTGVLREVLRTTGRSAVLFEDEYMVARVRDQLAADGLEPMRDYVPGYLGPADVPEELAGISAAVASFDFRELGRSGARLLGSRMDQGAGRPVRKAVSGEVIELSPEVTRK